MYKRPWLLRRQEFRCRVRSGHVCVPDSHSPVLFADNFFRLGWQVDRANIVEFAGRKLKLWVFTLNLSFLYP